MKALRYGISSLLVVGFAFVAACGGSTDDGGDSTNGTGGKSSSGGRSGMGAATAGTTNVPSNPAGCPASAPANATACTLTKQQTSCDYTGMNCSCVRRGGGGGMFPGGMAGAASMATREWQCMATLVCPATKPTAGDACTPAAGTCPYQGMGRCTCGQSSKWSCTGGGGPGGGTGGGFNAGTGGFNFGTGGFNFGTGGFNFGTGGRNFGAGGRNFGTGGFNFGTGGSADPGGGSCPATKPTAGSACTGTSSCPYTGGGCVCDGSAWTCL